VKVYPEFNLQFAEVKAVASAASAHLVVVVSHLQRVPDL